MSSPEVVYLALGTNLGNRTGNLALARKELSAFVEIRQESSIYETPPWGVTDQPAFLNQVVKGETSLPAHDLLTAVKRIETSMGRVPSVRYGPRLIDLDILLYGETVLESSDLVIPHPRMAGRAFVLVPLCEIAPTLKSPSTGQPYADLLSGMDTNGIVKWRR